MPEEPQSLRREDQARRSVPASDSREIEAMVRRITAGGQMLGEGNWVAA